MTSGKNRLQGIFSKKILLSISERRGFLLVLKGALRVYISSEGGREFTLYKVSQGGLCSLLPVDGAAEELDDGSGGPAEPFPSISELQPLTAAAPSRPAVSSPSERRSRVPVMPGP